MFKRLEVPFYTSDDFDKFEISPKANRDLIPNHIKECTKSMNKEGYFEESIIVVYKEKDKYYITDGNHRFEGAKAARIPFNFIIKPKKQAILQMKSKNNIARPWGAYQFIRYFTCKEEGLYNESIAELKKLIDTNNLPSSLVSAYISGNTGSNTNGGNSNGNDTRKIRNGTYNVPVEKLKAGENRLKISRDIINSCESFKKVRKSSYLHKALVHFIQAPKFNKNYFIDRCQKFECKIMPQTSVVGYKKMLVELYNYRTKQENRMAPLVS